VQSCAKDNTQSHIKTETKRQRPSSGSPAPTDALDLNTGLLIYHQLLGFILFLEMPNLDRKLIQLRKTAKKDGAGWCLSSRRKHAVGGNGEHALVWLYSSVLQPAAGKVFLCFQTDSGTCISLAVQYFFPALVHGLA
jgi:hypothetical protein